MMIPNSKYKYYCLGQCSATLVPQENCQQSRSRPMTMKRRELMLGLSVVPAIAIEPQPSEAREVLVGSYLPPSPSDPSFVLFKASAKDTPALRAGSFSYLLLSCLTLCNLMRRRMEYWKVVKTQKVPEENIPALSYFQGWIEWKKMRGRNLD